MKSVIYETKGRAREFNELAINLFTGCDHQCAYCYGADVLHKNKVEFSHPEIRITAHDVLRSAKQWNAKGETRRVLLCFITDPYQIMEQETQLTRKCITALHQEGLNVIILTKGGLRSTRDFDILTPKDAYATTLTCLSNQDSLHWEPQAALPSERIQALELAHSKGIETWVSLEPLIYPETAKYFVRELHNIIGHFKIGTMNYHPHGKSINWVKYGWEMKELCDNLGAKYYFKKDLLIAMGVVPEQFQQTWVCR